MTGDCDAVAAGLDRARRKWMPNRDKINGTL